MIIYQPIKLAGAGTHPNPLGTIGSKLTQGYNPSGNPSGDLTLVISNILAAVTIIAGLSFVYYFMAGAINWITAGGEPQKVTAAHAAILNAVIGLIITVIAYPALMLLSSLLGMPLASPSELFSQLTF